MIVFIPEPTVNARRPGENFLLRPSVIQSGTRLTPSIAVFLARFGTPPDFAWNTHAAHPNTKPSKGASCGSVGKSSTT
jgi:hypothetical protein